MSAVCTIESCGRTVLARGWCNRHYARWRKHGDPLVVVPKGTRRGGLCGDCGNAIDRPWRTTPRCTACVQEHNRAAARAWSKAHPDARRRSLYRWRTRHPEQWREIQRRSWAGRRERTAEERAVARDHARTIRRFMHPTRTSRPRDYVPRPAATPTYMTRVLRSVREMSA